MTLRLESSIMHTVLILIAGGRQNVE
jgi:hypothetical protein